MFEDLKNDELMQRFDGLVKSERKISHLILECILEIDVRKLYLDRAYSSLFDFLVKAHGYSPSAAMRRIDGARLLKVVPELGEKLADGSINLTQVSMLQQSCRELEKQKVEVTPAMKTDLLEKIETATAKETQVIIAKTLGVAPPKVQQTRHHADESATLTMTFTGNK